MSTTSMKKPIVRLKKLTDYRPALINPNKGTERGSQIIENSIAMGGAGRSMLADKNGEIIAGSHTLEAFVDAGFTDVIEVESDGTIPVIIRRIDTAIDEPKGMMLQVSDNRATILNYAEDRIVVAAIIQTLQGQDAQEIKGMGYSQGEINYILQSIDALPEIDTSADQPPIADAAPDKVLCCPNCGHRWIETNNTEKKP